MNADEVVGALRCCNRSRGHRCSECPVFSRYEHRICKATVDRFAADLIESLQAENRARNACKDKLVEQNKRVIRMLGASQRREKAAIDRQKELDDALRGMVNQYCTYKGKLEHEFMSAGEDAFEVLGVEEGAPVETLWRGPSEAEKEENNV